MAKLVVVNADLSTIDVPLSRERLTIGRRPDNDLCLPYPAVSSAHAMVVTILADSFLEDLDSTNGTLVNGKPIVKHFLRDHDQIDIGKQKLVYLLNDAERYEPTPAALAPLYRHALAERVDPGLKPIVNDDPLRVPAPSREMRALSDELDSGISSMQVSAEIDSMADVREDRMRGLPPLPAAAARGGIAASSPVHAPSVPNPDLTQALPPVAWIKVLSGPNAGRSLPLIKDETTVGRVGVSVAVVRKTPSGFVLVPAESKSAARVNGREVPEGGLLLKAGDEIEIAGTKLALVLPAKR